MRLIRRFIKWFVFRIMYPVCYRIASKRPVDKKKAVFVENHEDHMTDNYIPLYSELTKRNYDIRVHYLKIASSGWKDIIRRSISLIKDMGNAEYVFLNDSNSLFGSFKLRTETQLIQMWHACGAFKKWGFSVSDKSFGDDENELKKYSGHRNYTLMTVSGNEVCWAYEEAFGLSHESGIVQPIGVSRTDDYYDNNRISDAMKRLSKLPIDINNRKVIVYLPTFRGSIAKAKGPDNFTLNDCISLKDEYVILIKNHPFVKERLEIPEECRDFCVEISSEMTVFDMLVVSDICITDYSSVVFEYSLLNKPIIFYAYDIDDYDMERGFYYRYEDLVPGPIAHNMKELIEYIKNIESFDFTKLQDFRSRYMSGCDGHATERLLDTIGIL